jgi:hypothetical protein
MNQKVTDSLQTKKQEKTFLFMHQERGRIAGDRVSYEEEEEERKGKLLVVVI